MPDITMCKGGDCPLKEKCFRFLAQPDERQSFMGPPFEKKEDGTVTCEKFWEIVSAGVRPYPF